MGLVFFAVIVVILGVVMLDCMHFDWRLPMDNPFKKKFRDDGLYYRLGDLVNEPTDKVFSVLPEVWEEVRPVISGLAHWKKYAGEYESDAYKAFMHIFLDKEREWGYRAISKLILMTKQGKAFPYWDNRGGYFFEVVPGTENSILVYELFTWMEDTFASQGKKFEVYCAVDRKGEIRRITSNYGVDVFAHGGQKLVRMTRELMFAESEQEQEVVWQS